MCIPPPEQALWLDVATGKTPLPVGKETPVYLCVSLLTRGLVGFDVTVSAEDGSVASIVAVEFPGFGLETHSPLPSDTVRLRAVDLAGIVSEGTESAALATIRVRGLSPGVTGLSLSIKTVEDEDGNPVEPRVLETSLRVGPG